MPVGLVCEVNPYDEVWLELVVHISRNWKSVLGSLVGVCIACNFCSFLAKKGLIWHVVHKICKRIGAASYCTICTVGGAASLTRPLAEEIYTLKNYLTLPKLEKCTWPCLNVRPQCMSFWGGDIGDALWFSRHLTDWTISCIVPKIWAVDVAVKLRSRPKRWFLGHRFAEGIADIGHVFSNRSHFWAYGQYWFSSVHRARRLGGEKKKEERIRPKI